MLILHAIWSQGALRLWAESVEAWLKVPADAAQEPPEESSEPPAHPFAMPPGLLTERLRSGGLLGSECPAEARMVVQLPRLTAAPQPSERLAGILSPDEPEEGTADPFLAPFTIPCLRLPAAEALRLLLRIGAHGPSESIQHGSSLRYWIAVSRFVAELLADQRFIPTLIQEPGGLRASWQAWVHDKGIRSRTGALLLAMPPVCRAADDDHGGQPWSILREALIGLAEGTIRSVLVHEDFADALADVRDPSDPHVLWLSGLLGERAEVQAPPEAAMALLRDAGEWVSRLDETGAGKPMRLCLLLNEPPASVIAADTGPGVKDVPWRLTLHLHPADDPSRLIDAEQLWAQPAAARLRGADTAQQPQEILLAELGRAARIYPQLESALAEPAPTGLDLSTDEAHEFLREHRPVLEEAGFSVIVPAWWDQPASRLGARLLIESPPLESGADGAARLGPAAGLSATVRYRWQIAVGNHPLTMEEFQRLAEQRSPLVHVHGHWVEIRPEDMTRALSFLRERPGGEMQLLEAVRIAYGPEATEAGLPVVGLDATGWVADLLEQRFGDERVRDVPQPEGFHGTLRPYQRTGLGWLDFLDRLGLGGCLADDMGLGKTIQLIALLVHEREAGSELFARKVVRAKSCSREESGDEAGDRHAEPGTAARTNSQPPARNPRLGPSLLVVPTSVVSNWVRELHRFAPQITVHVHHGPDRPMDENFIEQARQVDVVITTYALVGRDRETLGRVEWHRVVLDEAQYIKNPPTKQAAAIRSLRAGRRLALTGTPVENRLSELWSIMDFCNPGYLGPAGEFRSRFAIPIERYRNQNRAEALRQLVRPFILRRVKTDPTVISDLPDYVETREFASLTAEQAALYEATVKRMLDVVDRAEGIQRRGLVLAGLVRLKQICNHPAQAGPAGNGALAGRTGNGAPAVPPNREDERSGTIDPQRLLSGTGELDGLARRSGKTLRLIELLEEVIASGERALVFTQFRQMGHLLTLMIRQELDCESLFLHGGTPQVKRQHLIDQFQSPQSEAPVFVLSLKAGGVGLNLTAANHVFHFDRWWNPAVESQATDRAFRIGQTRTVHVHKFVCTGTLEERIDQMLQEKSELAQNIIGAGEHWLTELSTGQLKDLLMLRRSALEVES